MEPPITVITQYCLLRKYNAELPSLSESMVNNIPTKNIQNMGNKDNWKEKLKD